jgi:hypothetical protein
MDFRKELAKDWLDKKGYYNSGLRTDRNHRIDLYLSDVLEEYRSEQLPSDEDSIKILLKTFAIFWNKERSDFVEIEDEDIEEFLNPE